jgi:ribosomal protein L37E
MIIINCRECGKETEKIHFAQKYCKPCALERQKKSRNLSAKKWNGRNRTLKTERQRLRYKNNPQKYRKFATDWYKKQRVIGLKHYGGDPPSCKCCGENRIEFLCFDHINGGGRKHIDSLNISMTVWLRKHNYPGGFRVLCYNCNNALAFHKQCPHEKEGTSGLNKRV